MSLLSLRLATVTHPCKHAAHQTPPTSPPRHNPRNARTPPTQAEVVSEEALTGWFSERHALPASPGCQEDPLKLSRHASAPVLSVFPPSQDPRVTAWPWLCGCRPCFKVPVTLAIFQCRTLITNYGSQSRVLNDPCNVSGDRARVISQFLLPSLTDREEWYHGIRRVSIQQETWWPFHVPDKRTLLPFCENANSKCLPYKSRFLWDRPSMSDRGRSKAPVPSEVGCLIGAHREVCLCTCGLIYMFASAVIFTALSEFDLLVRNGLW